MWTILKMLALAMLFFVGWKFADSMSKHAERDAVRCVRELFGLPTKEVVNPSERCDGDLEIPNRFHASKVVGLVHSGADDDARP